MRSSLRLNQTMLLYDKTDASVIGGSIINLMAGWK